MTRFRLVGLYFAWLARPRLLWISVGLVLISAAVIALSHNRQEACLRWWGMALQFLGIVSVVRELRGARLQFNKPGLLDLARQWLEQRPGKDRTLILGGVGMVAALGVSARLTIRAKTDPVAPIETRVKALETNLGRIDEELGQVHRAVDSERTARTQALQAETDARTQADARLDRTLEEISTGSLTFSLFGVVWLAVGLVLSSTSVEVAKWMAKLARWTGWLW
jgi:hypothetical protein